MDGNGIGVRFGSSNKKLKTLLLDSIDEASGGVDNATMHHETPFVV